MLINLHKVSPLPSNVIRFLIDISLKKNIRRMIVFGSRAYNDNQPKSDIDLAIEFFGYSNNEIFILKDYMEENLISLLFLSIVDLNQSPKKLRNTILKEGVIIYEHSKNNG